MFQFLLFVSKSDTVAVKTMKRVKESLIVIRDNSITGNQIVTISLVIPRASGVVKSRSCYAAVRASGDDCIVVQYTGVRYGCTRASGSTVSLP